MRTSSLSVLQLLVHAILIYQLRKHKVRVVRDMITIRDSEGSLNGSDYKVYMKKYFVLRPHVDHSFVYNY